MSHPRDGFAVAHFLAENGVAIDKALAVARAVDSTAETLRADSRRFLKPLGMNGQEQLAKAWRLAGGPGEDSPIALDLEGDRDDESSGLRYMPPGEALALFALAEKRTFHRRLEERNPAIADWLAFDHLPTGTELKHATGQRLMHAIRVSVGDKAPEAKLGMYVGNSFARVLCRNAKYCLYLHAVNVLIGDDAAAEATKELVDFLPWALPVAYGGFRGRRGLVFVVDDRRPF